MKDVFIIQKCFAFQEQLSVMRIAGVLGIQDGWCECPHCFSLAYLALHLSVVF